jgi:mono/diheme cytochrome c family protein
MKSFLLSMVFCSLPLAGGVELYQKYCSSCHGEDRLGKVAPPLFSLPPFFNLKEDEKLYQAIREGTTGMPAFRDLKEEDIRAIVEFIKRPIEKEKLRWNKDKIEESKGKIELEKISIMNLKDYTLVVERGKNLVWVMEGERVLTKFPFVNMHGGIKFSPKGEAYIPSRDGWIGKYSFSEGKLEKVRACIYLRNIALSPDGNLLVAACWIPSQLVLFDRELKHVKSIELEGRVNAVYELYGRNSFAFTFRDKPLVGFLDYQRLSVSYADIDSPLEDFTIDPFEEYLIGSTKDGLKVYSLRELKPLRELKTAGLPHLASAYFWYSGGKFYFATPIRKRPTLSLWRAYSWEHVKDIPLAGEGFLARSNYGTPFVWVDNSSDSMLLFDKREFNASSLKVIDGKRAVHTEFTGDGRIAYVSVYEKDGALVLYDGVSLKKLAEYPASLPAGKYNFVNKSKRFEPAQLGYQVFMEKCWGCHHTTREAFGPPLRWSVQNREISLIMAQILDPQNTHKLLGYSRSAMPKIELKEEEMKALIKFMEALKDGWMD